MPRYRVTVELLIDADNENDACIVAENLLDESPDIDGVYSSDVKEVEEA